MIRRALSSLVFCLAFGWSSIASAATMSDLWYHPGEDGWGVNIIEQQGTLFVTLFVYGPDGRATWYVGSNVSEVSASSGRMFTGALYVTTGPWFGGFFSPGQVGVRQVGSVTVSASSPVSAVLSYSVDGTSVSKSIQRQTWKHINLSGTYYGSMDALSSSSCTLTGAAAQPFNSTMSITATVASNGVQGNVTIGFTDSGGTSTFTGSYTQYGAIFDVSGTLSTSSGAFTAAIQDFTADDDGIRGNLLARAASGCVINWRFSAVRPG
jgi:hypothetical protein